MIKALPTNILVNHPCYGEILLEYNRQLEDNGKVNNLKFFREVIQPKIPHYTQESWYYFLRRFKRESGLLEATYPPATPAQVVQGEEAANKVVATMMDNKTATSVAISRALNIGAARLEEIMANPQLMSAKDAIDLIFKAMKAQDSRIHAIGKVKEDNREEEKMSRAFSNQAYGE